MSIPPLSDPLLLRNATPAQLELAAADNHRQLFLLEASAGNGEVQTAGGLSWTYTSPYHDAMVPFPSLTNENVGPMLDRMMAWFREHPPKGAGCWSLQPTQPASLGVRLLARGFQPGWKPCWMALDLAAMQHHPTPPGLQIHADNDTPTDTVPGLPYAGDDGAVSPALMQQFPDRAQRFLARLDGQIVGQTCVLFTKGEYGVAGIYNVGVVPAARRQGIARAVLLAACQHAAERGYQYATLNATGRRMYEQAGFRWIGNGHTWWLTNRNYLTHPPSSTLVALAEAIGLGDMAALSGMAGTFSPNELNAPLANGMTLMQLAVHCHRPLSAEWLLQHGAAYTALDAWDLHWKDRAAALLAADPEEVDRRYGQQQSTLLHIAAERNDAGLASLALSARPSMEIVDSANKATALDWAVYFNRTEIIRLIRSAGY
jgi:GNAT superfamily N-acetyltransferase